MEKGTKNLKDAQNPVVVDLNVLSTKPTKVKGESESNKTEAAFTLLPGSSISLITDYLGFKKLVKRFNDAGDKVYLSTMNINNSQITVDQLEGIVTGKFETTGGEGDIKGFVESELIKASDIYKLFYSKEAPRTKAHSFGFYLNSVGKIVFLAQQGCSIKEYSLFNE